ncbi:isocitrate/isopropylmalate family dehydrogenase [Acidicapsa acidisoli]|uniref:isocitrate/isopropylmalate family dehydrogenase n=1 Tax=Acidicapsa acidisoli TaxID=1615681 RepID=UPI0021E00483|nr:isocitrate/isopropylmalate family dehydrogenase [Acidicapsa acidisoli]
MLMKKFHIACLPADGIGPEVITSSRQILEKLTQLDGGIAFNFQYFDWSTTRYQEKGALMPEDGLQQLEQGGFDGILLGPVGSPHVPDHITLWGLLLPIRQGLDQYINLRPLRLLEGIDTPPSKSGIALSRYGLCPRKLRRRVCRRWRTCPHS